MSVKILVVDDESQFERLIRQRFRSQIRSEEYTFEFAQNGLEGLQKLGEITDFDIVLTDINMPQMDGLTFLSKMKELETSVKAIIISAYGDMKNIRTAMNLGAYDFVTKPINFEDLTITISRATKEIEKIRIAELAQEQLNHLKQELAVSSEIQKSILPTNFSTLTDNLPIELHAEMIPAKEVGGDFYDFFPIDEEHIGIVIGDVSGKGMPAALFMAVSHTLLRATGLKGTSVSECLSRVNEILCQDNSTSMFVTIFYGILNLNTGQLQYCNGGHNPPWIIQSDGQTICLNNFQNVALGVIENFKYRSQNISLKPNSTLILYTDGITEAINKNHDFFAEKRLELALKENATRSPKEIINQTIERVQSFSKDMPQFDDIAMLGVGIRK